MSALVLEGRHAVVTGAGGGIGGAIASELAEMGARVTLMGRTAQKLGLRRAALDGHSGAAVTVDVTDPVSVSRAFDEAIAAHGPVTILVNAAGIAEGASFEQTDLSLWRTTLEVDLTGAYLCISRMLPGALAAGWGRIVSVASTAGLRGYRYATAYCAAKHGLIGLTRALALETARTGVTVNAVCPGYADTAMTAKTVVEIAERTGRAAARVKETLERLNPQKRLIAPSEIALTVGWLCLPTSSSITGQSIAVAGGEVM